jgi:hypothetical protein
VFITRKIKTKTILSKPEKPTDFSFISCIDPVNVLPTISNPILLSYLDSCKKLFFTDEAWFLVSLTFTIIQHYWKSAIFSFFN